MCFFINIFHHLKLGIALAIPASNDEKYKQAIQRTRVNSFQMKSIYVQDEELDIESFVMS